MCGNGKKNGSIVNVALSFLTSFLEDQLNKGQKKERHLGDENKHAARCEVFVGERKQTWQWRETPHSRRGTKNGENAANRCQRCTGFSFPFAPQKPYTAFPPCSGVAQTAALIKRARHNFRRCGSRKATNRRKKIICVPDSNLNAPICLNLDAVEWIWPTIWLSAAPQDNTTVGCFFTSDGH